MAAPVQGSEHLAANELSTIRPDPANAFYIVLMRIYIVGFMCSGKSLVGRTLASLTGRRFVDLDHMIERQIGPILPWMERYGEARFREVESEVLGQLLTEEGVLVACGGGTPMAADNMDRMLAAGRVVYLQVSLPILVERAARSGGNRPLLHGLHGEALSQRINELLQVREAVYRRAPIHVSGDGPPEETAGLIMRALQLQEI